MTTTLETPSKSLRGALHALLFQHRATGLSDIDIAVQLDLDAAATRALLMHESETVREDSRLDPDGLPMSIYFTRHALPPNQTMGGFLAARNFDLARRSARAKTLRNTTVVTVAVVAAIGLLVHWDVPSLVVATLSELVSVRGKSAQSQEQPEEETKKSAGDAPVSRKAPDLDRSVPTWPKGSRFVYRYELSAPAGHADESAHQQYYVAWTLQALTPETWGYTAQFVETGGPADRASRRVVVTVEGDSMTIARGSHNTSRMSATGRQVKLPVGERQELARSFESQRETVLVSAEAGVLSDLRVSDDGVSRELTLIGYQAGTRRVGDYDHVARRCDWDVSETGVREYLELPLSGRHGFDSLTTVSSYDRSHVVLSGKGEDRVIVQRSMEMRDAKVWLDTDSGEELALFVFQGDGVLEVSVVNLSRNPYAPFSLSFEEPRHSRTAALMMSRGNTCFLQVKQSTTQGSGVQVADYDFVGSTLSRRGGRLQED